jgi:hypothetical protein
VQNQMLFPTNYDDFEAEYCSLPIHMTLCDVAVERCLEISGADGLRLAQLIMPRDLAVQIAFGIPYDLPHADCVRQLREAYPATLAADGVDVTQLSEEVNPLNRGILWDSVGGSDVCNRRGG